MGTGTVDWRATCRGLQLRTARVGTVLLAALSWWGLVGTVTSAQGEADNHGSEGVAAWGWNAFGQLGDGTTAGPGLCRAYSVTPCSATSVPVAELTRVKALAAGKEHGLALLRDGTVEAWGKNEEGQLGDGTTTNSDVPVTVCARAGGLGSPDACPRRLHGVVAISAGSWYSYPNEIANATGYSLALLRDGTVVAWGSNEFGQLADGGTAPSDVPVRVCAVGETKLPCAKPLRGVIAISAGPTFALALLRNGTVVAWGDNAKGQLGDGITVASSVPVPVSGLTGVRAIAAGGIFGLALRMDGTAMIWGVTSRSRLYEPPPVLTPVEVEGLQGATAIAAGYDFRLALMPDGTVKSWGNNESGQAGRAGFGGDQPETIPGLTEVTTIAASDWNGVALLKNGTVMDWGEGPFGQIGNGQYVWADRQEGRPNAGAPTTVCGLSGVRSIASGGELTLAYGSNTPGIPCPRLPVVWSVSPQSGPPGTAVQINGDNFAGAIGVKFISFRFGETAVAQFTVNSSTAITAIAPAHGGQPFVTTPEGTNEDLEGIIDAWPPTFSVTE